MKKKNTMKVGVFLLSLIFFIKLNSMDWAISSRQGIRETMEDKTIVVQNFNDKPQDTFVGLYDGHAGSRAAKYAQTKLHTKFIENLEKYPKVEDALSQSFSDIDSEIQNKFHYDGTTALVTYFLDEEAYFAWSGDSRALVIRDGKVIFSTRDHKPDSPEEKKRIEALGGMIIYSYGIARECNEKNNPTGLSVSRALGDRHDKFFFNNLVIADPEINKIQINSKDIMVFACDGVWDQLSNEDVANIIENTLHNIPPKTLVEEFMKKNKISPYYGQNEDVLAYAHFNNLHQKGKKDSGVESQLKLLDDQFPNGITQYKRDQKTLSQEFIKYLSIQGPDEQLDESRNNDDLARVARNIRDFAWALSKQNINGDNISVIVARKK